MELQSAHRRLDPSTLDDMDHKDVSPELLDLARQAVEEDLQSIDVNAPEGPLIRRRHLVELQQRLEVVSHDENHDDFDQPRIKQ